MSYNEILLVQGAATLLASSAVLLLGACVRYWRDFGARPQQHQKRVDHRITQLPRFA